MLGERHTTTINLCAQTNKFVMKVFIFYFKIFSNKRGSVPNYVDKTSCHKYKDNLKVGCVSETKNKSNLKA